MANNKTYNICGNWGLKCFSQHIVSNNNGVATGVILSCTLNGKKKQDGSYPKGIQVSVFCPLDGTCNIQECDYSNTLIDVNGTIGVREYTNKNNQFVSTLSIYASSVSIHEWKTETTTAVVTITATTATTDRITTVTTMVITATMETTVITVVTTVTTDRAIIVITVITTTVVTATITATTVIIMATTVAIMAVITVNAIYKRQCVAKPLTHGLMGKDEA